MTGEIVQKLKIGKFTTKLILNRPGDIQCFDGIIFDTAIVRPKYDLIFAFIFTLGEFTVLMDKVIDRDLLKPDGYLYFAYPKKGNKQYKEYIRRDDFFPSIRMDENGFVNGSPIKFNKMAAFNDVFTCIGLKYETRIKGRTQPSQRVADYIDRIPELKQSLAPKPEILGLYNKLPSGYRRNWARYVYGVKSGETRIKRLSEMENVLKAGFKSIDLYRQNK